MKSFDLQIIWSAQTPFTIPGLLALHIQITANRTVMPVNETVDKWFSAIDTEKKAELNFIHLN